MDLANVLRVLSCRQVYVPCCSASEQLEKMWWMVGSVWPQKGQLGWTLSLHCLRFSRVGRVSILALKRKDILPDGRPCMILFQTWLEFSNSATSRILLLIINFFRLLSWFPNTSCLSSLLHWLLRVLLKMVETDNLALSSRSTLDGSSGSCSTLYLWGSTGYPWWQDPPGSTAFLSLAWMYFGMCSVFRPFGILYIVRT